ncbi:MAG: hypothetical protein DYG89_15280 [Caldilinea sp. CFX5]|nr:hypothetical protein [Caldilinea sp. CFX5]
MCEPKPRSGSVRTVRRFLWWPLRLNDEWRWLEWADIVQVYHSRLVKVGIGDAYRVRWNNTCFADTANPWTASLPEETA